jgi:gliding motility-associated-like protein
MCLYASGQSSLTENIIACYPFTGNAKDGSGNHLDGSVSGATLTADRFGNPNSAYSFDGNDLISIPAATLKNVPYAYSIWLKITSHPPVGVSQVAFSIGDLNSGRHQTINVSNLYATAELTGINAGGHNLNGATNTTSLQSADQPSLNTWYHVVSVRTQTEMRLYVNGVLKATGSTVNAPPDYGSETRAHIGARCNFGQSFIGAIDDFTIYNRALSAADALQLYLNGVPCMHIDAPEVESVTHCGATSFSLEATGGMAYRWYDAAAGGNLIFEGNPLVTPSLTQTTHYYVSNVQAGLESDRVEVIASVFPSLEINCEMPLFAYVNEINPLKVDILSGTPPVNLVYTIGTSVFQTRDTVLYFRFESDGADDVRVEAIDANGCTSVCEETVEITTREYFVPNIITPNHDDKNETFNIYVKVGDDYIPFQSDLPYSLTIYNRYGKEIFRTDNPTRGWNGGESSTGIYYFVIRAAGNEYKGWVEKKF